MVTQLVTKDFKNLTREERGKVIYKSFKIIRTTKGWRVPSQSYYGKSYLVKLTKDYPICECPDNEIGRNKCKHIYAVEFYIKQEIDEEGNIKNTRGIKISYPQKWKAYDLSQTNEKLLFFKLLKDLCGNVEQPEYKFGRPKILLSDMIFSSALKVYSTFSLRRFMSDVKIANEKGFIDYTPCFASIGHFLQREDMTPVLSDLIKISALPLKSIETDFTIDSSGFSTCRFARYFDYKYNKNSKYRAWLKASLMSGVKTNIITSCEISEGFSHDVKFLPSLIKETSENFNIKEVSCDKAYSSRESLELINNMGAVPYIPFRSNTTGNSRGSYLWTKLYHYFMYKHDEFLQHYHKRSNAETVFHMIKSKFKDNLRSKTKTAQINELLCKVLCHNICVVIQEMAELGIKGEFVVEEKI